MQKRIAFRERKKLQELCAWAEFNANSDNWELYERTQKELSALKVKIMRIEGVNMISAFDHSDELARHFGCLEINN